MTVDLVLRGGRVVTPLGLAIADVAIDRGRVDAVVEPGDGPAPAATEVHDVTGRLVSPGFVDVQINGGWGHDFTAEPRSIAAVAAALPATGVTAFVPTVVSSPRSRRDEVLAAVAGPVDPLAAIPLGAHFEGPMLSPHRHGAHDRAHLAAPAQVELASWSRAAGVVMVTLAPELPGALAAIADLVARDVVVSAGHTDAATEQFLAGRDAGITSVTHLFNAMRPFLHREPGPIGATLDDPTLRAGLICDGLHVDPIAVRLAWRCLGPERMILVSDATAVLGAPHAASRLGGRAVTSGEAGVRLPDGTLAGSDLSLDVAVRNLVRFTGCDPVDALRTVTTTPADLLGLTDRGRVVPGARADLVVLDAGLHPERTYVGGRLVWRS